jgi:Tol biopolymer transport system component
VPLSPGTRLGAYEIIGAVGAGGMGEVYRASDTTLRREAAIKILPAAFATDPDRLARFEREARTLASLNHPNIAQIYGFEHTGDSRALVMEFVSGEDLAERLSGGPIPVEEAIVIARQIGDALEAAHEAGIIHRDLKPANIRVRSDGTVKVLDFGLAKMQDAAADPPSHAALNSPTITSPAAMTGIGMILGTGAYMAPEQARGKAVDKRADIWAFGVVLYEMLTGHRLFEGDTVSDALAAVLTREPEYARLPSETPRAVRALLQRTLQRDVRLRLRDIGEARIALSPAGIKPEGPATSQTASPGPRRGWLNVLPWALVGATALVAGAITWNRNGSQQTSAEAPALSLGIDAGGDTPLAGVGWAGLNWVGPTAVLSPDGRTIAFIARRPAGGRWQLYVRRLDELKATGLPGTEGAYAPFFSPDGRSIGFFAGGQLSKVTLGGGAVTTICAAEEGRGGAWASDGTIVFTPRPEGPLFRVSADGGVPAPVTTLDAGETTHRWPQVLPGGTHVLFTAHDDKSASRSGTIEVQALAGGERKVIHRGALSGRYSSSGHLLYVQDGRLFAAPFDLTRLEVTGRSVPVVDDVAHSLTNGTAQFAVSDTGLLAYRRARNPKRILQWIDFAGQFQSLRDLPAEYQELRFSPDSKRLLLVIGDGAQSDVWVYDLTGDRISRLTFHPDNDWSPIWSPDGSRFAYASWRADVGTFNIFVHRTDGTGEPQRLTTSRNQQLPMAWHPSGRYLLYSEHRRGTGVDLKLLPLEPTESDWRAGTSSVLLGSPANESSGEFSPDGRWLAYTSDESGRSEVYVRPFPGPGGRWQVSTEGAEWLEWRKQILYGRSEEVVLSVPYRIDGLTFVAEKPRVWMRIPPGVLWLDPSPDSLHAAVIRSEDTRRESMVLLVNFFDHLRRIVGSPGS